MRILQVMAGGEHGGAETAFADMCLALREAGQAVEAVTRNHPARLKLLGDAGIRAHVLPFGRQIDIFTPWRLNKIIRDFKPDIIQTWMSRGTEKTPGWHSGMGIPRYVVVARLGGYYKLKYFRSADYFIANVPGIRRYLIKNGVAEDHVCHINNFAELEKADAPADRAAWGTPVDAKLVLAMGRLHPCKGYDVLIKAVAGLPGVHLWIAGEGKLRGELEALIASLKVADRVKLLGWRNDRAALFQASDVCVMPSRLEPFGAVFAQAWEQKVPLIASATEGPLQFVRDGEDGLIVPIDDVEGFRAAIQRVLSDKELARRMAEQGYIRHQQEFTKASTVHRYLDFYGEILAREGLTRPALKV